MTQGDLEAGEWCGNFQGWCSHRKLIPGEENPLGLATIEEIELRPDERVAATQAIV
jgi:hypothetical protein